MRNLTLVSVLFALICGASAVHATEPCEPSCSCDHYASGTDFFQEGFGIPTNARFFVPIEGSSPAITLTKDSDPSVPIALTVEEELSHAVWVRPDSELDPDTEYTLSVEGERVVSLGTGPGPDMHPPPSIELSTEAYPDGESCENFVGFLLTSPDLPTDTNSLMKVVLSRADQQDVVRFYRTYMSNTLAFGDSDQGATYCAEQFASSAPTLPGATVGEDVTVKVTLYSEAGIEGPEVTIAGATVQPVSSGDPNEMSGACSSCLCASAGAPASSSGGLFAVGALALLAHRRRRQVF